MESIAITKEMEWSSMSQRMMRSSSVPVRRVESPPAEGEPNLVAAGTTDTYAEITWTEV